MYEVIGIIDANSRRYCQCNLVAQILEEEKELMSPTEIFGEVIAPEEIVDITAD